MNPEFITTLPENLRNEPALQGITDAGALAAKYVEASKQPKNGEAWRSQIPEEHKSEKIFTEPKDLPTVFKNYANVNRLIGSSIRLPKDDAKQEEKDKFYADIYTKLGRPASIEAYEYKRPEVPEEAAWDEAAEKGFLKEVHALGLNSKQVQGVMNWYAKFVNDHFQAGDQLASEAVTKLKEEWGGNYDKNLAYAQRTLMQLGGEEAVELVNQTGIGNHPAFIKLFAKIGRELAEDGIISGEVSGATTKEEAQRKLNEILANKDHAYFNRENPGHEQAIKEVTDLYRIMHD